MAKARTDRNRPRSHYSPKPHLAKKLSPASRVGWISAALALGLVGFVDIDAAFAQKAQMVKGTVKSADPSKNLLVINQIVKEEKVDRELSITATTTFTIKDGDKTTEATGKEGLELLKSKVGATVAVKCDKDVNVLSVTVTVAKKK